MIFNDYNRNSRKKNTKKNLIKNTKMTMPPVLNSNNLEIKKIKINNKY